MAYTKDSPYFAPPSTPKYSLPVKDMEMLRRIARGGKTADAAVRTAPPATKPAPAPAKPALDPFFRRQAERSARIYGQIAGEAAKLWGRA